MEWREFADQIWDQLQPMARQRIDGMNWYREMDRDLFRGFIEVAWYASMIAEEHHGCCARIVLGRSAKPSIAFAEPVTYEQGTVSKLSMMVNQGLRQLVVHVVDGRLCIKGVRDPFFRYRRWLSSLAEAHHPDNHLMLRIVGPGHIRLGYPVERELRLGNSHFLTPLSHVQSFEDWFAELGADLDHRTQATESAAGVFAVQRIWTEILRHVVDREGGGIFLIVPEAQTEWNAFVQMAPGMRSNATILKDTLSEMRAIEPGLPAYSQVTGEHNARLINMAHFHERDLSLATQMVAAMTRVDGAVVLSRSLTLIGFGVKIAAEPTLDVCEHVRRGDRMEVVPWEGFSIRGARHHAAVNFVGSVPQAIAVVISEDGDISVFSHCRDHVAFERVTLNEDWHDVEH